MQVNFEQLLQCAVTHGHSAAIRLILSKPSIDPTAGSSALLESVILGNADAVQVLLGSGYGPDLWDESGMTLLHRAVIIGYQELSRY
jgi:ankyrin repeat protein